MTVLFKTTLLGAALVLGSLGNAHAQVVTYSYGDSSTYGYGGPFVRGEYIGVPLTRVPRPSELVPSAWGYGTYGIPTVAGIRQAPTGTPTLYVIESPARAAPRRSEARSRVLTRGRDGRWSEGTFRSRIGPRREVARSAGPRQMPDTLGSAHLGSAGLGSARVVPVNVTR